MNQTIAGWDIGGAHLKLVCVEADGSVSMTKQYPAPLWQGLDNLQQALQQALSVMPPVERHAVTMTAELADCFPDRGIGVQTIIDCLTTVMDADTIGIYGLEGFLTIDEARQQPLTVASANWHAAATWLAQCIDAAMLADMGSTTSDFIPVADGKVQTMGSTDHERLQYDELVYSGIVRTPVIAVAHRAPVGERWQHLAAEVFATMADVYRLTGELPEDADIGATPDGAPADVPSSARRLARQAGCDYRNEELPLWRGLAAFLAGRQLETLAQAAERCLRNAELRQPVPVVGSGNGRFLARKIADWLQRPYVDVVELLPHSSEGAAERLPAYAVGWHMLQASMHETY